MKNVCAKRVTPATAYEVWQARDGQLFYVLKKYQADDTAPYARWLVASTNQWNDKISAGSDAWVADIKRGSVKLEVNPLATPVASEG